MLKQVCAILLFLGLTIPLAAQLPLLYPSRVQGKYGYVDASNTERLKYMFEWATPFSEGYAFVLNGIWGGYVRENGTWAFYDSTLKSGQPMKQGLAEGRKETGAGVVDSTGKIIVPFEYASVHRFDNNRVFLAFKYIDDASGRKTVAHLYSYAGMKVAADFDDALWQPGGCVIGMKQNDRYWLYGRDAKGLLGYQVDDLYAGVYGTRVKLNNLYGAINRYGQLVLPIRYKELWVSEWQPYANYRTTTDSTAYFDMDNSRVAFDFRGILPNPISDGAAIISYINNVHNVLDVTGQRIGQLVSFEDTSRAAQGAYVRTFFQMHYSDGIVAMRHKDKKWYAYSKQGRLAFPKGYDFAFAFKQGVAVVHTDGYSYQYGLVDKTGREVLPLEYKSIYYTDEPGILEVTKDDKCGLIKTDGTVVFPLQPVRFSSYGNGFFLVTGNYSLNYKEYGYFNARTGFVYFNTQE